MIVYIVTAGEYDSYRICGAYATEQAAESSIAELMKPEHAEMELELLRWTMDGGLINYRRYSRANWRGAGEPIIGKLTSHDAWVFRECSAERENPFAEPPPTWTVVQQS